ncbi:Rabenosyn-5 [Aphelenchoides bicaudatus]|nr:Rabenosyn-5 [Aphelenchoides bicaudatus]
MEGEEKFVQGFLCPFCMEDLGDVERLQQHVDSVHSADDSNTDAIDVIKGMFAKAKSKLNEIDFTRSLSGQGINSDLRSPSANQYGNEFFSDKPQKAGVTRGHTSYFAEIQRDYTEISTVHTNTLILRLDKLLSEHATKGMNRKDFEKQTVPWADDSEVTNCRVCNLKFSLTKRKHHCRLCGKVICATCSKHLSFKSAQKITSYVSMPTDADLEAIEDNENYMRICAMCKEHLQRYELRRDLNTVSSVFVDLYAKLQSLLIQINNLAPSFCRMAWSLQSGESLYNLESAIQLRKKIVYIQSEIADLSERIEKWGLNNDPIAPRKPTPREMIVQKNIRILAITSIQELIANMPEIPSQEKYEQLHKQHKEKVANREKARTFYMEDSHRDDSDPQRRSNPSINRLGRTESTSSDIMLNGNRNPNTLRASASFSAFTNNISGDDDSWAPSTQVSTSKKVNPFLGDDENEATEEDLHPISQQYLILKNYLKQAVQAGRHDEIVSLEKSLIECEEELMKLGLGTPRAS